jgi:signal transduction histidine kinase
VCTHILYFTPYFRIKLNTGLINLLRSIVCITLFLLTAFTAVVCTGKDIPLTVQERAWLDRHKVITVGPAPDSPPFEFFDDKGSYRGMSADYLAWIGQQLGVRFKPVHAASWAELMDMARHKKVDLMTGIVPSAGRKKFLVFTEPWITVPGVVIASTGCRSIDDLRGKTVAVVNDSIWDDYLTGRSEDFSLVRVKDVRTALELTATSGVYAMVANLASATEMIHKMGIGNLRVVLRLDKKTEMTFGVRKDWPLLVSILNKSLSAMDPDLKKDIRQRWIKLDALPWWKNVAHQRTAFFIMLFFLAALIFLVTWNRILKQQAQKRTAELEQANRHLIRAAKMESVGQLAAGVAHEVKNPLAIISMGVELLGDNPDLDEVEKQILVDMDDAVERADRVVRGLLDYSRYSKLNLQPGDLNEVIEKALRMVEHEMKKNHVQVQKTLGPLKPARFDFNRVQQVFINLFMNSAQVMQDGGRLEIVSELHRLNMNEAKRSKVFEPGMEVIRVRVMDTGPGIARKDWENVFDPFYTTKGVGEGTGLGLSESRNIMELHNGTLYMTSCGQQKTGACAVVMLPLEQGEGNEKNSAR